MFVPVTNLTLHSHENIHRNTLLRNIINKAVPPRKNCTQQLSATHCANTVRLAAWASRQHQGQTSVKRQPTKTNDNHQKNLAQGSYAIPDPLWQSSCLRKTMFCFCSSRSLRVHVTSVQLAVYSNRHKSPVPQDTIYTEHVPSTILLKSHPLL